MNKGNLFSFQFRLLFQYTDNGYAASMDHHEARREAPLTQIVTSLANRSAQIA